MFPNLRLLVLVGLVGVLRLAPGVEPHVVFEIGERGREVVEMVGEQAAVAALVEQRRVGQSSRSVTRYAWRNKRSST